MDKQTANNAKLDLETNLIEKDTMKCHRQNKDTLEMSHTKLLPSWQLSKNRFYDWLQARQNVLGLLSIVMGTLLWNK